MGRRHLGGSGQAVILDGLPEDATERDILYGLDHVTRHRHFSNDVVRIVRLRYDHDGVCSLTFLNTLTPHSPFCGQALA